ncbi:DNA damage-responsive transcriptional repressor RPH1 [Apiospora saccharicola]
MAHYLTRLPYFETCVKGCKRAKLHGTTECTKTAQAQVDLDEDKQTWQYMGRTSTEARAQYMGSYMMSMKYQEGLKKKGVTRLTRRLETVENRVTNMGASLSGHVALSDLTRILAELRQEIKNTRASKSDLIPLDERFEEIEDEDLPNRVDALEGRADDLESSPLVVLGSGGAVTRLRPLKGKKGKKRKTPTERKTRAAKKAKH